METVIDVNNPLEDVVTDGPFAHLRRVKDICFLDGGWIFISLQKIKSLPFILNKR